MDIIRDMKVTFIPLRPYQFGRFPQLQNDCARILVRIEVTFIVIATSLG
jgi:hypothetical protein